MVKRYGLFILVLLCASLAAAAANAQWVKNGVPAGSWIETQYTTRIASDGAGGAMISWSDVRTGVDWDIYGNRVTGDGVVLGGAGVPICSAAGNQWNTGIVYDGMGGAIFIWLDERFGVMHIFAQKVDTAGVMLWTADGIDVCPGAPNPGNPVAAPDGAGGVIVTWYDYRNSDNDIFAQRIDGDGNLLWGDSGLAVCTVPSEQSAPAIVSDGAGGAIIAWTDYRGDGDIYAQRIDGDGNLLWEMLAVPVCTAGNNQFTARLAPASGGGAYVLWSDMREGYDDAYVQWIDPDGLPAWQMDGISVCDDVGWGYSKYTPSIAADGFDGAAVAWGESRDGDSYELFAQRFDPDGTRAWGASGTKIIPSYSWNGELAVISDGAGGVIVAADVYWDENSPTDIYAQRVDYDGNLLWGSRSIALCTATGYQYNPVIIPDGFSGAIVAWDDYRDETGGNADVYCQRIGASGLWGDPAPEIVSCLDLPNDQGGWVRIKTRASSQDKAGEDVPIFGYNVWRLIAGGGGPLAMPASAAMGLPVDRSKLAALLADPATAKGVRVSASQAAALGLPEGDWESVGFWFATRDTVYNIAVPTKDDSTETGVPIETYIVTAHTSIAGVFVASEPSTGYSVDNLAPGVTPGFAGNESASPYGLALSWTPNSASDLWKYNVYRSDDELFVPDGSNQIGTTDGTQLFDGSWVNGSMYFYKLVAVDRHGNLSPAALLRPEDINVGTMLQSFAALLSGGAIEISWTLSEAGADARFVVLRSEAALGVFEELDSPQIAREGLTFSLSDQSVEPGTTYRYRVNVVDETGSRTLFETQSISMPAMPLTLNQNHPNPFNPSTTIGYYLPVDSPVTLEVYDTSGRLVARLLDGAKQEKGTHSVAWRGVDTQGRSVSSGVYFYRLTSGKETLSRKLILLR